MQLATMRECSVFEREDSSTPRCAGGRPGTTVHDGLDGAPRVF
jgi:hypothetical protein